MVASQGKARWFQLHDYWSSHTKAPAHENRANSHEMCAYKPDR
jgi:hypothetical protein